MIQQNSFWNNQQHLVAIFWLVAITFSFGVAVGLSSKSLFSDSQHSQRSQVRDGVQGRFGHVEKTF